MVSEVVDAPEQTDQVPATEVTEDAPPVVETEAVAAPEGEEAAVPEPITAAEPEGRRYTEAELAEQRRQAADEAAARAIEIDRQNRQAFERRRADEAAFKERETAALTERVETQLIRKGIDDPDLVKEIVARTSTAKAEVSTQIVEQSFNDDFGSAISYLTGQADAGTLTPRQIRVAATLREWYDRGAQTGSGEMIPKSELPKYVAAEIARQKAQSREGKTELKRADGTSSTIDRSWEATVARIAAGNYDTTDQEAYTARRASRRT